MICNSAINENHLTRTKKEKRSKGCHLRLSDPDEKSVNSTPEAISTGCHFVFVSKVLLKHSHAFVSLRLSMSALALKTAIIIVRDHMMTLLQGQSAAMSVALSDNIEAKSSYQSVIS